MNAEFSSASRRLARSKTFRVTSRKVVHPNRTVGRLSRSILLSSIALVLTGLLGLELQSSWLESRLLAAIAKRISFSRGPGASDAIHYSGAGPYDKRLGYLRLPDFLNHLKAAGFRLEAQARVSRLYLLLAKLRIYPVYREKGQAGLEILDRDKTPFYAARYPSRAYGKFSEIPPIIVSLILYVENRDLLDPNHPYRNPAIGWGRLSRAVVNFGLHEVDPNRPIIGGSTLATQLEKIRHSPGGRTHSVAEKFRQIATASLRAYRGGPETFSEQQRIVLDYINSIPLAATPAGGEVTGLGDGLWAWYGADFSTINFLLNAQEEALDEEKLRQRARGYREVLSLFLALRAPSRYLVRAPNALARQTDRYLLLLSKDGIISDRLRDLALAEHPGLHPASTGNQETQFVNNKAPDTVRAALLPLLGLKDTYALDRLDLTVGTTIDNGAEQQVKQFLLALSHPGEVKKSGPPQYQLLSEGDPGAVIYSFLLYERGSGANLLRVQTDDYEQPLSINQGTKLQLGSTAKLRTLVNYLQIVEQLHDQYQAMSQRELSAVTFTPDDIITKWVISYFSAGNEKRLAPMFMAALDRRYSGDPSEGFFTAGGLQYFENFDSKENDWITTVREAFEQSVNLVFIRLMRDIEHYYMYRLPGASPAVMSDTNNPARKRYLARFADEEGRVFLSRFHEKYLGHSSDQSLETLVRGIHPTAHRLAVIYRAVRPRANLEQFSEFLRAHVPTALLSGKDLETLYLTCGPDKFSFTDRGYLAHTHPLELWLLSYLEQHPRATLSEIIANSTTQRQEVYRWLFHTRYKGAQDHRIRTIWEEDAFKEICLAWKQQGYPFDSLVPSYATAIGVSGDTPAALAELMGIVLNGGVRYPNVTVREMRFAQNTPVETVLQREPNLSQRVLSPEIAALVRQELIAVVEKGTGRRAHGGIMLHDRTVIPIGGKTGTGDNQFKVFGKDGRPIGSHAVNRTAAFAFLVGDRFFGTVLAFVPGKKAEDYEFTSSLAVQIFKELEPAIEQLMERKEE